MNTETKKVYLAWCEKGLCYLNGLHVYDTLFEVDQALQKCDEILGEVDLGIGYKPKASDIEKVIEGRGTLRMYIDALPYYIFKIGRN